MGPDITNKQVPVSVCSHVIVVRGHVIVVCSHVIVVPVSVCSHVIVASLSQDLAGHTFSLVIHLVISVASL